MTKAIKNTIIILNIIIMLWLALSYAEILSKNIFGGATYSDYNIIVNGINYLNKIYFGGIF